MSYPLVSVVIVTWNRKEEVGITVESVLDQLYERTEIVVVDNASTDGTVEMLRQQFPMVKIVELEENTGPTGGRNAGIAAARGEILFFLDSDASVGENTLARTVDKFKSDHQIGAVACKVVNAETRQLDNIAGWIFSEKDKVDQDEEFLSFSFSECGCAIRKEALKRTGGFWDYLFFGREGEELAIRIWDADYQIVYFPKAIVYHRVSPSKRVRGCDRLYYDLRNSLYIHVVRYTRGMLLRMTPLRIGAGMLRALRRRCTLRVIGAILEVFQSMPYLLKQRDPIREETARKYVDLQREHGPLNWDLRSWIRYKL